MFYRNKFIATKHYCNKNFVAITYCHRVYCNSGQQNFVVAIGVYCKNWVYYNKTFHCNRAFNWVSSWVDILYYLNFFVARLKQITKYLFDSKSNQCRDSFTKTKRLQFTPRFVVGQTSWICFQECILRLYIFTMSLFFWNSTTLNTS